MPKRRTRITPKYRKRSKRSVSSASEGKDSQNEPSPSSQESEQEVSQDKSPKQSSSIKSTRLPRKRSRDNTVRTQEPTTKNSRKTSTRVLKKDEENNESKGRKSQRTKALSARKTEAPQAKGDTTERIQDLRVAKTTYNKWQPLSSSSKEYIKQVLQNTVSNILSTVTAVDDKEAVQQDLTLLNERVFRALDSLRGPKTDSQYRNTEVPCRNLEEELTSSNNQLALLEKELEEQKKLLAEEEDQLDAYTNQLIPAQFDHDEWHPFLRIEPIDVLHLPKLPPESLEKPVLKVPNDVARGGASDLTHALTQLDNQVLQLGPVKKWLEIVSLLHNSICDSTDTR